MIKFRGYNTKDEWRDVVVTMVKYGAELKEPEIEVLVDYLGKHFSKNQYKAGGPVGWWGRSGTARAGLPGLPAPPALPAVLPLHHRDVPLGVLPTAMRATSFRDATSIAETAFALSTAT